MIFQALLERRADAVLYENARENYLYKHNNIKYKGLGAEGYVEITKVRECRRRPNPEFWRDKRVYLGVDLSQTDDNTALAMVTVKDAILYVEDLEPLGLQGVLYDQKSGTVYTPNTNRTSKIFGEEWIDKTAEKRANPYHDGKTGRFTTGTGKGQRGGLGVPQGFSKNKQGEKTLDKRKRTRYDKTSLGQKTSDDIEIKHISAHAYDRAAQRMISPETILNNLGFKAKPSVKNKACNVYDGNRLRVVAERKTGSIVSVMRRRSAN